MESIPCDSLCQFGSEGRQTPMFVGHVADQPAPQHKSICHFFHWFRQEFYFELFGTFSVNLILSTLDCLNGTDLRMDILHCTGCLSDRAHHLVQNLPALHKRFRLMVTLLFLKRIRFLVSSTD